MTLTFFVLMILIALILGAWWAFVDAVVSGNWYTRRTTPSDEPSMLVNGQRVTERELLVQLGAQMPDQKTALLGNMPSQYGPLSFTQPARKGFKKRGVSAGTKTPPTTPAA